MKWVGWLIVATLLVLPGTAFAGPDDDEKGCGCGGAVQVEAAETGATVQLRVDAVNGGHAQSSARELGGEERIENAGAGLLVHATSRIGDLEGDTLARFPVVTVWKRQSTGTVEGTGILVSGDTDAATGLYARLRSVDDQIHDNLLDLCEVGLDMPGNRLESFFQFDVFTN